MKALLKHALDRLVQHKTLRDVLVNALARKGWVAGVRNNPFPSETSLRRAILAPWCQGNGIDLGFGGDPIHETAIRVDLQQPYATGIHPTQLAGDAARLHWFADGVLDFVYSSHLLEDFEDTAGILREWLRVLKPGGHLVILCPDEQRYRRHCETTGHPYNNHHIHGDFPPATATVHRIGEHCD